MAFTVQTDDGLTANANAYITADEFKTYHQDRGNVINGGVSDIQKAIVRATTYLDTRFTFKGRRLNTRDQTTAFPRTNCYDRDRNYVNGVPREVKDACAEYALRALSVDLSPDPQNLSTGTAVSEKSEKVGPIEESTKYVVGAPFVMPKYPTADRILTMAGLTMDSNQIHRGN